MTRPRPSWLRASALLCCALALALSACGNDADSDETADDPDGSSVAIDAVGDIIVLGSEAPFLRPSAPMGIFTAVYMAKPFFLSTTAVKGVAAQVLLHALPDEEQIETTYSLLDEFGSVIQVDITDVLNRSEDRAETLNDYLEGLRNITARSEQKATETDQYIERLETERRTLRGTVADLERSRRDAIENQDFAGAGEIQQDLSAEQAKLSTLEADLELQQNVLASFSDLLEVATNRIDAIDKNKEALIAGVRVVDVPGVENLGVLEGGRRSRTRSRSTFGL